MVDKFLRDLIPFLAPEYAICPRSTSAAAERHICEALHIKSNKAICWQENPQYVQIKGSGDIISSVERLLGRSLEKDELTIYLLCAGYPGRVVKARLDRVIEHYSDMPWFGTAWMWNPEVGYVVEDCGGGDIIVGMAQKCEDLAPYFTVQKNCLVRTSDLKESLARCLENPVDYATIWIVGDIMANRLLTSYMEYVPFTIWGHLDWMRINRRKWIGADASRIRQAFEQLTGRPWVADTVLYVQLNDPAMLLLGMTLAPILARLPSLQGLSYEIFLFDEEMRYIVEIDALSQITVGIR